MGITERMIRWNRARKLWEMKTYIKLLQDLGNGSETVMICSPNDPKKKVVETLHYKENGVPKSHTHEREVYNHPVKTVDEWCREWKL